MKTAITQESEINKPRKTKDPRISHSSCFPISASSQIVKLMIKAWLIKLREFYCSNKSNLKRIVLSQTFPAS